MNIKPIGIVIVILLLAAACSQSPVNETAIPTSTSAAAKVRSTVSFAPKPSSPKISPTPSATAEMQALPLELDMDPEAVRQMLLFSHENWKSIFVDGVTSWYPNGASQPAQSTREQLWIDQSIPAYRRISGAAGGTDGGAAQNFYASDGKNILEMDLQTGSSQLSAMPYFSPTVAEFTPPLTFSDTIYRHPLAGTIGSPFDDWIFPTGLGQREGTFKNVTVEEVAGRTCLVVDWFFPDGIRASRYWVDAETGVLLKGQDFGKGGGDDLQSEFVVNQVEYDLPLAESLFNLQLEAMPQWSSESGEASDTARPVPTAPFFPYGDKNGWVYFYAIEPIYGNETVRLLRLPGSCLQNPDSCPEAQEIATPFPLKFSLMPLVWSPQGDAAALAYPVSEDGNTAQLLLFNPLDGSWTQLAQYNFIDPPIWSPDGQWLAFRVQDGQGGENLYAIRRDGTGLTDLVSALQAVSRSAAPYRLLGISSAGAILQASGPDNTPQFYAVPLDGSPSLLLPMDNPSPDWLAASPDGNALLLGRSMDGGRQDLELADGFGVVQRTLASFKDGSFGWMGWSPDGTRAAFVHTTDTEPMAADVHVFNMADGVLSQVYRGQTIGGLAFSPDGGMLVIQDDDPTGRHLFTVDLDTLEQRLVQSPNVGLDEWWLAPSWQPLW